MIATLALVAIGAALSPTSDRGAADLPWARADDDYVGVWASRPGLGVDHEERPSFSSSVGIPPDHLQRMRAPACAVTSKAGPEPCPGDPVTPLPECGDAATLPELWERPAPDGLPHGWRLVAPPVCATPADVTPAMVLTAFRRLPLAPGRLVVQPDRGWVLVNKPVVVHAEAGPQTLTTSILGTHVTVTARSTGYRWDFGDGATLSTADPGRPWPDGSLTHGYGRVGTYRVGLTTTWSATYTLAGDPTVRDVPGTATTTSVSAPFTVREYRAHLVSGECAPGTSDPGC